MNQRTHWWKKSKDPDDERLRAMDCLTECAKIEQRQATWHELNLWNSTLYTNRELIGFRWGAEENAEKELWPSNLRTENLIENIGQAMLSKASSSPIRPALVPHGNSYKTARAVRIADRFLFGVWRMTKAEDACVQMFNDAYTAGIGCVQVAYDKAGKSVHVESVFFDNIVIDNRECGNRAPPKTYRIRKVVPREAIEAQYDIDLTPNARPDGSSKPPYVTSRPMGTGWVPIVQVWRMPDAGKKNGWTMTACEDRILDEGPWEQKQPPLVFFHWQDRQSGFFTKGGVEQVIPFQVIQNDLNDDIKEAQDVSCRPRILMPANTQIDASQWDSKAGRILLYAGMKPENMNIDSNVGELYQERERNKAAAYSHMGLSEMFANADMPQQVRLDSSAGVREFRNMEDARHLRLWTTFQDARLAVAQTIMMVLSISEGAEAFTSVYHPQGAGASSKDIPYEAIKHLTTDQYAWTFEAIPMSAASAAARRELLRDNASRGQLGPQGTEEAKRMESMPNLEMIEDLELASKEDIERHIQIMEEGGYEAPDEFTNLSMGMMMVTAHRSRLLRYEDVTKEDKIIKDHSAWILKAASITTAITAPPEQEMVPYQPTQGVNGTSSAQGV